MLGCNVLAKQSKAYNVSDGLSVILALALSRYFVLKPRLRLYGIVTKLVTIQVKNNSKST